MTLYKHKSTAINGILNYLEYKYPNCVTLQEIKRTKVCKPIHDLVKNFRFSVEPKKPISKYMDKNIEYTSNNFYLFTEYLKQNNGKF